ncbi:MAG: cytidine deaminase [Pirellulales bacterium]
MNGNSAAIPDPIQEWILEARKAAKQAHCPYSRFPVGAVLGDLQGNKFLGCNIENASFGLTLCAERTAAATAIQLGSREWSSLVIVSPTAVAPCGACRQFLIEFVPDLEIWLAGLEDSVPVRKTRLQWLLPDAISRSDVRSVHGG